MKIQLHVYPHQHHLKYVWTPIGARSAQHRKTCTIALGAVDAHISFIYYKDTI